MRIFKEEEAISESIKYFDGDELAATTWVNKYAMRDENGNLLESNPQMMHDRLIEKILEKENSYQNHKLNTKILKELLYNFKYVIPGGSVMSGLGNNHKITSLSNCFVIKSPTDSYGGIMRADEELIQLSKRRGGVGLDLSNLRPSNAKVTNDAKTSSGLVSFMERYSNSTREVCQNGRRGALMLTVSILHPDSEDFINSKLDLTKITGANISVKVTNDFMKSVESDSLFLQRFPINSTLNDLGLKESDFKNYKIGKLYNGIKSGTYFKVIKAKSLWNKIIKNNTKSAEPGILFFDTILAESPADIYKANGYETVSTNPCLTGDTKVLMADGTEKEIKNIKRGDLVISVDLATGWRKISTVVWSGLTRKNADIINIDAIYSDKKYKLKCTPDHPIAVRDTDKIYYTEAELIDTQKLILFTKDDQKYSDSISIEKCTNTEDVYDIMLDSVHNFFANGILVHNCGEIPLPPYDSCRLIAINLYSFVKDSYTDKAKFDYNKLAKYAGYTQRIMDNIIDCEIDHIESIIEKIKSDPEDDSTKLVELNLWNNILIKTKEGRRTGVGITGLGDALAALNVTYGSDESIEISEKIQKTITLSCYKESIKLAKERGSFTVWDSHELEIKHPFLTRIFENLDKESQSDWKSYGRRNIACNTIAPTGTVSLMTQTTSGIEPEFKCWYTRRRKTDDKSKASFIDKTGDMFEEFNVIRRGFIEWADINELGIGYINSKDRLSKLPETNLIKLYEKSPYYKATAQDVNWIKKVELQGRMQKWIDHSISVTVNLPKGTDEYIVAKVYETAYKSGCKGTTVYVDGSRDGVLVTKTESDNHTLDTPRPNSLPAKIFRFKNSGENWIAFVGILNEHPYEIFTGKIDDDIRYLPKSITEGHIIRVELDEDPTTRKKPHRYDFQYKISHNYVNTLPAISSIFRQDYWNYAKFLSSMLRSGMPIVQIVNVIEGLKSDTGEIINSWKAGVSRALRGFIKDGEKSGKYCDKCGGELVYQSGCKICSQCGDTKCE